MDPSICTFIFLIYQTDWFFVLKYPFCQQYFVLIYKNAGETNLLLC